MIQEWYLSSFADKQNLKKHVVEAVHEGINPFRCSICDLFANNYNPLIQEWYISSFADKQNLKKHVEAVLVYSVNYNFCLNKISLNFYRINSETAFPFSQSHTAVFACGFNQEFTLLYGQFLTVWCQNCQAGGVEHRIKISKDITRMFIGSRFKTLFF